MSGKGDSRTGPGQVLAQGKARVQEVETDLHLQRPARPWMRSLQTGGPHSREPAPCGLWCGWTSLKGRGPQPCLANPSRDRRDIQSTSLSSVLQCGCRHPQGGPPASLTPSFPPAQGPTGVPGLNPTTAMQQTSTGLTDLPSCAPSPLCSPQALPSAPQPSGHHASTSSFQLAPVCGCPAVCWAGPAAP